MAQALAEHVPGATLVAGGTGRTLTLTLGTDGAQVTVTSGAAPPVVTTAVRSDQRHADVHRRLVRQLTAVTREGSV